METAVRLADTKHEHEYIHVQNYATGGCTPITR